MISPRVCAAVVGRLVIVVVSGGSAGFRLHRH
jgi:hypothetical protein